MVDPSDARTTSGEIPWELTILPPEDPLVPEVAEVARGAAERLELPRYLARVELRLDDFEPDRRVWLDLRATEATHDARRRLILYLHPQELLRDRPSASELFGARPVWEPQQRPIAPLAYTRSDLQRAKAERFFLHQFLFVRDLCDGSLALERIPEALTEAVQEAWSITVDGRLRRWRLPAASLAERRAGFSRLFARHGVLLPDHWRIFHQLWEREDLDLDQIVALVRRLPW